MNKQTVMWACPICIAPMTFLADFANGAVHRYKCKFCKRKFDISQVSEGKSNK